jgi:hypothetical protein
MMNRRLFNVSVPSALALVLTAGARRQLLADDKTADKGPTKLAKDLIGTWLLAGTPDKVEEPPADGGRYKFFTGKYWTVTQADPTSGEVIYHHGGTYTLDGDNYEETVLYSTKNNAELIKQKFKFKIKVEGDTFTQLGVGNPYNEVWKRAK